MTLTEILLTALFLAALAIIYQAGRIIKFLDSLGDLLGDQLRAIIDQIRKDNTK